MPLKDTKPKSLSLQNADWKFQGFSEHESLFCVLFVQIEMNSMMCNKGFLKASSFFLLLKETNLSISYFDLMAK